MGSIGNRPVANADVWLSSFIFEGTVKKQFAATMPIVPVSDTTAVVEVQEVYRWPASVRDFAGEQVTVVVANPKATVRDGRALFFAEGWLYGESLAVVEVARMERVDPREVERSIEEAQKASGEAEVRARVDAADLVVMGVVTETHRAPEEKQTGIITEHDPDWWQAVLSVESVEKGKLEDDRPVVNFPRSDDEFWVDCPKLSEGQKAVFLLQRDQQEKGWPLMRIPGWTALDPLDVQPPEEVDRIRELIAQRR